MTEFAQQSDKSQGHQELGTIHSPIATEISHSRANSIFHAKESKRTPILDSQCEQQSPTMPKCPVDPNPGSSEIISDYLASHPSPETLLQSFVKLGPRCEPRHVSQWIVHGKTVIRWREDASTAPGPTYEFIVHRSELNSDGFRKGWNEYWENLEFLSTQLSEAINSMFRWYHGAANCYVYLADDSRRHCRGKLLDRDCVWVVTQTMVIFEHLTLWAAHAMLTYKVYPGFWGRANSYHNHETGLLIQKLSHQTEVTW